MWRRRYQVPDQQCIREMGSFVSGMLAAKLGRPITDCPHKCTSKKKDAWLKGYHSERQSS